jgi:hypothetical protein
MINIVDPGVSAGGIGYDEVAQAEGSRTELRLALCRPERSKRGPPHRATFVPQVEYRTRTWAGNTRVPSNVTPGRLSKATSRSFGSLARGTNPALVTPLHS